TLVAIALFLAACSRSETPAASAVGARCLDCHADLTRAYRATGMARATDVVRKGELAGLAEVADSATGWSYLPAGNAIAERWKGRPLRELPLGFAIGAGLMDRSYVAQVGDLDWFAPLENVRRVAALAPGHSIRPGMRFTIPITQECLGCHTDR